MFGALAMMIHGVSKDPAEEARFNTALTAFVAALQARSDEHYKRVYPMLHPDVFVVSPGGAKFLRVVRHGTGDSVYCFIRREDGAVLKAESWSRPEKKHVRGSIYGDDPLKGTGLYGPDYIVRRGR